MDRYSIYGNRQLTQKVGKKYRIDTGRIKFGWTLSRLNRMRLDYFEQLNENGCMPFEFSKCSFLLSASTDKSIT